MVNDENTLAVDSWVLTRRDSGVRRFQKAFRVHNCTTHFGQQEVHLIIENKKAQLLMHLLMTFVNTLRTFLRLE